MVLEDVDLVAQERTFGPFGSNPVLFELMNEMSGLAEDADVAFVLTTNRPDALEPALAARADELPLVVKAVGIVTQGLDAKTVLHTCYGNYEDIYGYFNRLPVDQLDLEMSNSSLDLLDRFRRDPLKKEIAFGVIDVHSHVVETQAQVAERIEKALAIFDPQKLVIDPDCGLKTRTVDEAKAKLEVMVRAARAAKAEHGFA